MNIVYILGCSVNTLYNVRAFCKHWTFVDIVLYTMVSATNVLDWEEEQGGRPDTSFFFLWGWKSDYSECKSVYSLYLGVERNRKQRNPVNSITSWIVSGTLLCTGSTGPFIATSSLKDFFSSCKEEKFPRQDIRYYLKYVCKEEGRNTGVTRIFCRHVMI